MEPLRLGVDEAGRGPVIGPLVVALVGVTPDVCEELTAAGVTDSKAVLPAKRERLATLIRDTATFCETYEAEPEEIDAALRDPSMNLNLLEAKITAQLIARLLDRGLGGVVTIDLPSRNAEAYRAAIARFLGRPMDSVKLVLEHKADANHVEAAAASIIAKTLRDARIEAIKTDISIDFGSGYPADPKTRAFLQEHWKTHEELFRTSWASYEQVAESTGQRTLR